MEMADISGWNSDIRSFGAKKGESLVRALATRPSLLLMSRSSRPGVYGFCARIARRSVCADTTALFVCTTSRTPW